MKGYPKHRLTRLAAAALSVTVFSLALSACSSTTSADNGKDSIHIGSILGLSGVAASYGQQIQQGQDLAVSQANASGGIDGRNISVEVKNSNYTPSQALADYKGLAADSSNLAILGPNDSTDGIAVTALANAKQIPTLLQGAAGTWPTPFGEYLFLAAAGNADLIPVSLKAAVQKNPKIKTAALLYASDESYAATTAKIYQDAANANGVQIATTGTFASSAQDFSAELTKIKNSNVQAVLVSALAPNLGPLLIQAHSLGLSNVQWICDTGCTDTSWTKAAGALANDVLTTIPFLSTSTKPVDAAFVKAFQEKYQNTPTLYSAYGYDSANAIITAMRSLKGNLTRQGIRQALTKLTFDGVTGSFSYPSGSGNSSRTNLTAVVMRDGAFTEIH